MVSLSDMLAGSVSRPLDHLYASLGAMQGQFFPLGWGDLRVVDFQEDVKTIQTWPPPTLKINWKEIEQGTKGGVQYKLYEGSFKTPCLKRIYDGLPPESRTARAQLLVPAGVSIRNSGGISSLVLESPTGARSLSTNRSKLLRISDLLTLGFATIYESVCLLHMLKVDGYEDLCISGLSMGGVHACMTAGLYPGEVACSPLLAPRSAAVAYCDGAMHSAMSWEPLLKDKTEITEVHGLTIDNAAQAVTVTIGNAAQVVSTIGNAAQVVSTIGNAAQVVSTIGNAAQAVSVMRTATYALTELEHLLAQRRLSQANAGYPINPSPEGEIVAAATNAAQALEAASAAVDAVAAQALDAASAAVDAVSASMLSGRPSASFGGLGVTSHPVPVDLAGSPLFPPHSDQATSSQATPSPATSQASPSSPSADRGAPGASHHQHRAHPHPGGHDKTPTAKDSSTYQPHPAQPDPHPSSEAGRHRNFVPHPTNKLATELPGTDTASTFYRRLDRTLTGLSSSVRNLSRNDHDLRHEETKRKLKMVLETYTDVTRYPRPRRPDAAVLVAAIDDAYVSTKSVEVVHKYYTGSEMRLVSGGHVSAFLMHHHSFQSAIADSIRRLKNPQHNRENTA
eukprot:gene25352-11012_t